MMTITLAKILHQPNPAQHIYTNIQNANTNASRDPESHVCGLCCCDGAVSMVLSRAGSISNILSESLVDSNTGLELREFTEVSQDEFERLSGGRSESVLCVK